MSSTKATLESTILEPAIVFVLNEPFLKLLRPPNKGQQRVRPSVRSHGSIGRVEVAPNVASVHHVEHNRDTLVSFTAPAAPQIHGVHSETNEMQALHFLNTNKGSTVTHR